MACEISKEKNEVVVVYNENYVREDDIVDSIENEGYMVI